jgi:uncharacterized membrane protein YoaK (UPF0700 family)
MADPLTRTLLALTAVTGIVDAVTFLALGQVFAAMQTGNVVFLGLGIGDAAGAPFWAPAIALAAFLAGSLAAAPLDRGGGRGDGGLGAGMAVEAVALAGAALLAATVDVERGESAAYLVIAVLAAAMGMRNTVARRAGDPNLATTVLNLTMTALAAATPTGLASHAELGLRAVSVAAILAGAVAGALLLKVSLALPLAVAAALVAATALAHRRAADPPPPLRSRA